MRIRLLLLVLTTGALVPATAAATAAPDTSLAAAQALLERVRQHDQAQGFEYSAEVMIYSQSGDSIVLRGSPARVIHGRARLEAAELVFRRSPRTVEARARRDSSGRLTGLPVLRRGDEVLRGERIVYDLEHEEGRILHGYIQRDKGFYAGEQIHTLSAKEFHVRNGTYTTCDYAAPHFDFYSPRIKVLVDEMAIARPVYVRVNQHRVFWIPFYVFSLRSGRQSGILTPSFGRRPLRFGSSQTEWEIRNLGYYFAPNDYWDVTVTGNLRQQSGWLARADLVYALRYHFDGSAALQYESRQSGDHQNRAWRLDLRHRQDLGADGHLRASGAFQSNRSFAQDNSNSLQDRLSRTLRSNLSYSRRWPQSGNSVSVSASQTRNLDTEVAERVLPEIRFVKARKALWGGDDRGRTQRGTPWFGHIYYTADARIRNRRYASTVDTTTTTWASASFSASSQHKPLPFLQFAPQFTTSWQDPDLRRGRQRSRRAEQLAAVASLSQTFYGLFPTRLWRITATRHELKPNLSFSYRAAHADTGGVLGFGGHSGAWDQHRRLSMRLDNTFWAKLEHGEEESKVRLAQLNLSTAYDFENHRRPLDDLTTVLSLGAGRVLTSRLTMRSEMYDDRDHLRLLAPRLRRLELNTSFRYHSRAAHSTGSARSTAAGGDYSYPLGDAAAAPALRSRQYSAGDTAGSRLQLTHYYARSRYGTRTTTRSWIRLGTGFALGRAHYHGSTRSRWHVDYSLNYNLHAPAQPLLTTHRFTSELLSVQRAFHDWSATLHIQPATFHRDRTFYFRVQLRDIPQIKLERGDARL